MIAQVCIVEQSTVDTMLAKSREEFLTVFAEEEKTYCLDKKKWKMHLSARFAAKKAVYELLGAGAEMKWNTILIRHHASGAPSLLLREGAAERADRLKVVRWHLSLTHTDQYAAAFVVAEEEEEENHPLGEVCIC